MTKKKHKWLKVAIWAGLIITACSGCSKIDTKYYSGRFSQDGANAVYISESRVPINFSHEGKHLTGDVVQERKTWFEPKIAE